MPDKVMENIAQLPHITYIDGELISTKFPWFGTHIKQRFKQTFYSSQTNYLLFIRMANVVQIFHPFLMFKYFYS